MALSPKEATGSSRFSVNGTTSASDGKLAGDELWEQRITNSGESAGLYFAAPQALDNRFHDFACSAHQRGRRNCQLRIREMMSLDVPHRRRLSRRDVSEVFEMQMNREIAKPTRIAERDYLDLNRCWFSAPHPPAHNTHSSEPDQENRMSPSCTT